MNDIVFEILKCIVMIAALVVARYLVPWLKSVVESNKLSYVVKWATNAVLNAQQVLKESSGEEKKESVTKFLQNFLASKDIVITDEQLDVLIEAAVKEMKIAENEGTKDGLVANE